MTPAIEAFDHIHVYVADRSAAEAWYRDVFGFQRVKDLEFWAEGGGPLTIENDSGSVHIALFERTKQPCRSTIALRVTAPAYRQWKSHLEQVLGGKFTEEDHQASLSLYFSDPDGNPYEITTYDIAAARG
jgi:catechol-2,3-dioxygenase